MRKTILAATIALSAAIGAAGTTMIGGAGAQPAPPPALGEAAPPPSTGFGGPSHQPHFMHHGWRGGAFGSLIYRPEDRQLTAPEVQKIAEAFLLWNGNRTWKVTEVSERPDNLVSFAFATSDGSVIARFTMDRKTGRVSRIG